MTVINNTIRTASRVVSKRTMSDAAGPRMHKAKTAWKEIQATRPPEGHPHVSSNDNPIGVVGCCWRLYWCCWFWVYDEYSTCTLGTSVCR